MSYLDHHAHAKHRTSAAIGVGAIHVILALGLTAGLAVKTIIEDEEGPLEGIFVETELPPPPPKVEPEATVIPRVTPPSVPTPELDLNPTPPDFTVSDQVPVVTDLVLIPIPGKVEPPAPSPLPKIAPSYPPVAAAPSNGPLGWITNDDYPSTSIRRIEEGNVSYRLAIGSDGRVDGCSITRSSGHARLDEATCRLVERRARFTPAKDETGAAVAGTYTGQVTWRIPE